MPAPLSRRSCAIRGVGMAPSTRWRNNFTESVDLYVINSRERGRAPDREESQRIARPPIRARPAIPGNSAGLAGERPRSVRSGTRCTTTTPVAGHENKTNARIQNRSGTTGAGNRPPHGAGCAAKRRVGLRSGARPEAGGAGSDPRPGRSRAHRRIDARPSVRH
jgi:hypothetical protein